VLLCIFYTNIYRFKHINKIFSVIITQISFRDLGTIPKAGRYLCCKPTPIVIPAGIALLYRAGSVLFYAAMVAGAAPIAKFLFGARLPVVWWR
jgi:hypothetical protein